MLYAGVLPNTDWLKGTGVDLSPKGHVIVSKYNKTNVGNIFAAGDCTSFPLKMNGDAMTSIGHYQMALGHGM